jgi:serine/threonine protein kinase
MLANSGMGLGLGGTSSAPKRSKCADANKRNPQWPPIEYTQFVRPVAMKYYAHKSMDMLECNFLNGGMDIYVELCKDLCCEFMKELDDSEKFNNYLDYWEHVKWLDHIVTTNTNNVVKGSFGFLYRKKKDEEYDESKKKLLAKLLKVQATCQRYFGSRMKTMPWQVQALKGAMEAHMGGRVVWLPKHAKVIEIPGARIEGGYAKVQWVQITRMEKVPSDIEFAGKLPKASKEFDKRNERSLEALACPISHASVIKFWALHPKTMEAYTLWWNGGSLKSFWTNYNSKVSEATSYKDYHLVNAGLLPVNVDKVKAYRKNRVKLVLSLLTIMGKCHAENIIHNDLSPSNIMLHFPPEKSENVYIGMCNWGMANRFEEEKSSFYGYQTKAEMEANIAERKHVAPELFYVFGPKGLQKLLEVINFGCLDTVQTDLFKLEMPECCFCKEI